QREARSSSMKSESFLSKPRLLCYAFCKNTNLSVSAELDPSKQIFEWFPPRSVTFGQPSLSATFVATCFTDSTFFRLRYPLCENDGKIFLCWLSALLIVARRM